MISVIQKVGGSLGEEQFAKQCGENRSLLLVGGRHKQITMITQAGDDSKDLDLSPKNVRVTPSFPL